jgi:hypothetical protein
MADEPATLTDPEAKPEDPEHRPSRLGHFIQTYSAFLSSFVIGIAGLVATSIWQWRQSEIAARQSDSQQKLAEIKAQNDWRIERAEILSKNLSVLSTHGADSAEQRYGVLLSLTRGNILDPELAVSYALELGKDNPDYMRSVLSSTENKNYSQLLHAFQLNCVQRFGITRDVEACKGDKASERWTEISDLVSDELTAAQQQGKPGPLSLLADEAGVHASAGKLAWLFEPYLSDLYQRRAFKDIERFEQFSVGARLVAALVLATEHTGEFVSADEANTLEKFHSDRRKWLAGYLFGRTCDAECKGRLVDLMLTVYGEAQGDYDDTLRHLLLRPRAEVGNAIAKLHQRLLWCQVDGDDLDLFRDKVLVPALNAALEGGKGADAPASTAMDDVAALLAIVPAPTDPAAKTAFDTVVERLHKASSEHYQKSYVARKNVADHERHDPPPSVKKSTFCNAPATTPAPITP